MCFPVRTVCFVWIIELWHTIDWRGPRIENTYTEGEYQMPTLYTMPGTCSYGSFRGASQSIVDLQKSDLASAC
ncbi:hypothetical protein ACMYR2_2784 [Nitrobacter sp. TKz-YC01]